MMTMLPIVLFAGVTVSQSAPQMQVQAEPSTLGVGEVVQVQLSATSADAMPSDPQLGATPGFAVRGQNSAPANTGGHEENSHGEGVARSNAR